MAVIRPHGGFTSGRPWGPMPTRFALKAAMASGSKKPPSPPAGGPPRAPEPPRPGGPPAGAPSTTRGTDVGHIGAGFVGGGQRQPAGVGDRGDVHDSRFRIERASGP